MILVSLIEDGCKSLSFLKANIIGEMTERKRVILMDQISFSRVTKVLENIYTVLFGFFVLTLLIWFQAKYYAYSCVWCVRTMDNLSIKIPLYILSGWFLIKKKKDGQIKQNQLKLCMINACKFLRKEYMFKILPTLQI